jgi:hypothetical protein
MDRIVDMLQCIGMYDEIERTFGVWQAMNVDLRVNGEDMPAELSEDRAQAAGFVDFQDGLRRPPFDNVLQQALVLEVRSDRIGERDRAEI